MGSSSTGVSGVAPISGFTFIVREFDVVREFGVVVLNTEINVENGNSDGGSLECQ